MKPEERQKQIWNYLRLQQRNVTIDELSQEFAVSALTIRRDLNKLANFKGIIITPGGALFIGNAAQEIHFNKRVAINWKLKNAIAKEAVKLVSENDVILTSAGSSISHFLSNLPEDFSGTIFTSSLSAMTDVTNHDKIKLYLLGGEYRPNQYGLFGSLCESFVKNLVVDVVILGADSIDEKGNCLATDIETSRMTSMFLKAGKKKMLLADHTKINGTRGCITYGNVKDFDIWITTRGIPENLLETFREKVDIREAGVEG